jgi:hypothetical protein
MAWQRHGRYYYRSERDGARVRSRYLGYGTDAELIAKLEALQQAEATAARESWRQQQEAMAQEDRQITAIDTVIEMLAHACLTAAGYHRHHCGEWRKRRAAADGRHTCSDLESE